MLPYFNQVANTYFLFYTIKYANIYNTHYYVYIYGVIIMQQKAQLVINAVKQVVIGKDDIITKVFLAILSKGHILLDDNPGMGKTTLALAFSKVLDFDYKRIQCTPDVLPTDITGFMYINPDTHKWNFRQGPIFTNLLLADEINRASPKTQSALLEAMEERQVTVDNSTFTIADPFTVIATQNPFGSIGTQMLPESQVDRFMICTQIGYPDNYSEVNILKNNQKSTNHLTNIITKQELLMMQSAIQNVYIKDDLYQYIIRLANATRNNANVRLGISPRGSIALMNISKACAWLNQRDYVVPSDILYPIYETFEHRILLSAEARANDITAKKIIDDILGQNPPPKI